MIGTAADPQAARTQPVSQHDLVFSFFTEGWAGARDRGWYMPDSRLAQHVLDSDRVGQLVVANNQRSLPILLLRRALGERTADFPASDRRQLIEPKRLRRLDPWRLGPLRRTIRSLDATLRRAAERSGLEQPVVITANPFLAGLGELSWARAVTYYGIDDWAVHPLLERWKPALEASYDGMRERGRRVCTVTRTGVERIAPTGPSLALPNGLDPAEWLGPPPPSRPAGEGPLLVYVGSLDARLDTQMVLSAARELPDARIALVGPALDAKHLEPLSAAANVEIMPRIGRSEVAALIRSADVGLVPHARTPLTAAMSPLKLYEYLAGGLPVAAIDLPPMRDVDDRVVLASEPSDFPAAVRQAVALGRAPERERQSFVMANSWNSRLEQLLDLAFAA
jgi:teichuronic acid biosynthesis glycosyltransferase TuaH